MKNIHLIILRILFWVGRFFKHFHTHLCTDLCSTKAYSNSAIIVCLDHNLKSGLEKVATRRKITRAPLKSNQHQGRRAPPELLKKYNLPSFWGGQPTKLHHNAPNIQAGKESRTVTAGNRLTIYFYLHADTRALNPLPTGAIPLRPHFWSET